MLLLDVYKCMSDTDLIHLKTKNGVSVECLVGSIPIPYLSYVVTKIRAEYGGDIVVDIEE